MLHECREVVSYFSKSCKMFGYVNTFVWTFFERTCSGELLFSALPYPSPFEKVEQLVRRHVEVGTVGAMFRKCVSRIMHPLFAHTISFISYVDFTELLKLSVYTSSNCDKTNFVSLFLRLNELSHIKQL